MANSGQDGHFWMIHPRIQATRLLRWSKNDKQKSGLGNLGNSTTGGFQTLRDPIFVEQPPVVGNHGVIRITVEDIRASDEVRVQRVRSPGDEDLEGQWPATNEVGAPAAQAALGGREHMMTMI
jgi:hypothetical protein